MRPARELVDLVLVVRVEVDHDEYDSMIYDAEELVRSRLDQPVAGSAEIRKYEFVLSSVKHED